MVDMGNYSNDSNNIGCIFCHKNNLIISNCLRCTRFGYLSPNCKFIFKHKYSLYLQ